MEKPFEKTSPRRALAGLDGPSKVGGDYGERHLVAASEFTLEPGGDADGRVAARVFEQVEAADEVVERVVGAVAVKPRAVRAHAEAIGSHRAGSCADQRVRAHRQEGLAHPVAVNDRATSTGVQETVDTELYQAL